MEEYKLFDAEYRLMELVWNLEPVNSTALARRCEAELGWKKSTVFNLIRKLAGRGFLKNEHRAGEAGAGAPVRERGGGGAGLRRFPARLRGRLPAGEEAFSAGGRRAAADARRKRGGP